MTSFALRNQALQLGMSHSKSRVFKLPQGVIDGNLKVVEVDCMTGDLFCEDGSVINHTIEHKCIALKVYEYMLNLLTKNKTQSV